MTNRFVLWMLLLCVMPLQAGEWFQGGTLHKATADEWISASPRNKLATCSDWVAAWSNKSMTVKTYGSMDEIRRDAERLKAALDRAALGLNGNDEVAPLVVLSAQLLQIIK